jgi:hypothetical protein
VGYATESKRCHRRPKTRTRGTVRDASGYPAARTRTAAQSPRRQWLEGLDCRVGRRSGKKFGRAWLAESALSTSDAGPEADLKSKRRPESQYASCFLPTSMIFLLSTQHAAPCLSRWSKTFLSRFLPRILFLDPQRAWTISWLHSASLDLKNLR